MLRDAQSQKYKTENKKIYVTHSVTIPREKWRASFSSIPYFDKRRFGWPPFSIRAATELIVS